MNPEFAQRIIATMRIGGPTEDAAELLKNLRLRDWEKTLSWMRRSGLALYWWARIKQSNAAISVPEPVAQSLERDTCENQARLDAMAEEFRALVNLFEDSRIPYAVLKGFALTPEYCFDPALRTQYDFDFLVLPQSLTRVNSLLLEAGFVRKHHRSSGGPIEYFHSQRQPVLPDNLDRVFSAGLYRTVEIHTSLWDANAERIQLVLPGDSLRKIQARMWNGISFQSLSREDTLIFQVLHIFRHILNNQCRLSHLFELANFLLRHTEPDKTWQDFEQLIQRDRHLKEAAGVVFSLATKLFEVPLPHSIRALTVGQLRSAAEFWVSRYGVRSALQNFTGSKSSLYLHCLFIQDERDWRQIRRRKLLPIHKLAGITHRSQMPMADRVLSQSARATRVIRRSWFHATAALQYAWGLPEWRRVWQSEIEHPALGRARNTAFKAEPTGMK